MHNSWWVFYLKNEVAALQLSYHLFIQTIDPPRLAWINLDWISEIWVNLIGFDPTTNYSEGKHWTI